MQANNSPLIVFNHKQLVNRQFSRTAEVFTSLNELDWIKKGAFFQPMRLFKAYTPWVCRCSIQTDNNSKVEQGQEENPFAIVVYLDWPKYSAIVVDRQDQPQQYLNQITDYLKKLDCIQCKDLLTIKENSNYCPPNCWLQ
jgi:hypothetical protein